MHHNKSIIYFVTVLIIIGSLTAGLLGQTRSRVSGVVHDHETGAPLVGVNIIIVDTDLGAASDINGNYIIINVPVGTYNVRASMIGYEAQVLTRVMVLSLIHI